MVRSARCLEPRSKSALHRALHAPVLHVSPKVRRGGRHACVGCGFRRWKTEVDITTSTITPPSSAAPRTPSAMCFAATCAASFIHVSPKGSARGRHACVGHGFRPWKLPCATMNTFTLPSFAAPNTSSATSRATSCAASFTCPSFTCSYSTCRPREGVGDDTRVLSLGSAAGRWRVPR